MKFLNLLIICHIGGFVFKVWLCIHKVYANIITYTLVVIELTI